MTIHRGTPMTSACMSCCRSSLAFSLALALTAGAQQPDRSTFYLIVGTDTLTVERSTRTPTSLDVEIFDRKTRSRVQLAGKLTPAALVESATLSIFVNPSLQSISVSSGAKGVDVRSGVMSSPMPSPFASTCLSGYARAVASLINPRCSKTSTKV